MSELNARHNRIVWCDIPVADLDRASAFYRAVLAIKVDRMSRSGASAPTARHSLKSPSTTHGVRSARTRCASHPAWTC